jgi:hypothetical protein
MPPLAAPPEETVPPDAVPEEPPVFIDEPPEPPVVADEPPEPEDEPPVLVDTPPEPAEPPALAASSASLFDELESSEHESATSESAAAMGKVAAKLFRIHELCMDDRHDGSRMRVRAGADMALLRDRWNYGDWQRPSSTQTAFEQ